MLPFVTKRIVGTLSIICLGSFAAGLVALILTGPTLFAALALCSGIVSSFAALAVIVIDAMTN